ncbi:MAG: replication-associated recombination protein A, partial [Asticcacaulis sp.]|nr:replication-associated recombination protein A [Asticcacaulis sp.]
SFEVNSALLSRAVVYVLQPLGEADLKQIVAKVLAEKALPAIASIADAAADRLVAYADGDARRLLNTLESLSVAAKAEKVTEVTDAWLLKVLGERLRRYDKGGEQFYDTISALHKSVRGSDPDAALYWLARMLNGGDDPLFIARRLIRMASEDIGNADPMSLLLCHAARDTYEVLGSPEGELALAQAVVHMASAPKSNAVYTAYKKAAALARETGHLDPPAVILNAPTKLMKDIGYSQGYIYDPDDPDGFSGQNYFPDGIKRPKFYDPVGDGHEGKVKQRLEYWSDLRDKKQKARGES